jgi:radical SAM protein with 4Fe4S-binding SPASM domain
VYAKLAGRCALRGWKGLPYALLDTVTLGVRVLDAREFSVFEMFTGDIDMDLVILDDEQKKCLDRAAVDGFVSFSEQPAPVTPWQRYRVSEGGYINSLLWSITGACDQACRHCYMGAGHHQYPDLSTRQCLDIVRQMEEANIAGVELSGGEPLLRPDFWQIVDALTSRGIRVYGLHTNGPLLDDVFFSNMEKRSLDWRFVLSFDGAGRHDHLHAAPGSEEKTLAAIKRLREKGKYVYVKTKLHKGNLDSLLPAYETLKALGIDKWKVSFIMAVGDWKRSGQAELSAADCFAAYEKLLARYFADGQPMVLGLHEGVFKGGKGGGVTSSPHGREAEAAAGYKALSCHSCRSRPYLLPNGRLLPCWGLVGSELETALPLLTRTTLAKVYGDPEGPFRKLVDIRAGDVIAHNKECTECGFAVKCGGGCRADAILGGSGVMGKSVYACRILKDGYYARLHKIAAAAGPQEFPGRR